MRLVACAVREDWVVSEPCLHLVVISRSHVGRAGGLQQHCAAHLAARLCGACARADSVKPAQGALTKVCLALQVAERYWSLMSVTDLTAAQPRLAAHACRMQRRGVGNGAITEFAIALGRVLSARSCAQARWRLASACRSIEGGTSQQPWAPCERSGGQNANLQVNDAVPARSTTTVRFVMCPSCILHNHRAKQRRRKEAQDGLTGVPGSRERAALTGPRGHSILLISAATGHLDV